jgi:hypothetical protein
MQNDSSDACADILTLTREQLYDRVWDEPAYMLAPQLGISDVALAKTCKRLGIPKPSRGYWARLGNGCKRISCRRQSRINRRSFNFTLLII